jgi:hypothetical protein
VTPIAQLQRLVLEALLTGHPLPGSERLLTLPDAAAFLPAPPVPLSPENIADPSLLPDEVRLTPPDDGAHLRFAAPETDGGAVWITLELRLGAGALSGTRTCFRQRDGRWAAVGAPAMFAS